MYFTVYNGLSSIILFNSHNSSVLIDISLTSQLRKIIQKSFSRLYSKEGRTWIQSLGLRCQDCAQLVSK